MKMAAFDINLSSPYKDRSVALKLSTHTLLPEKTLKAFTLGARGKVERKCYKFM